MIQYFVMRSYKLNERYTPLTMTYALPRVPRTSRLAPTLRLSTLMRPLPALSAIKTAVLLSFETILTERHSMGIFIFGPARVGDEKRKGSKRPSSPPNPKPTLERAATHIPKFDS